MNRASSSLFAVVASAMLVDMATSREQLRQALAAYQQQLAQRPDDARTLLKVGDLHLRADEPAEAVVVYRRAAEVFAKDGKHLQAIAVWKHVIQLLRDRAPELAAKITEVVLLLVASFLALGRDDDAIAVGEEGAEALERFGLHDEAAELRRRAVELSGNNLHSG